jgi:hypothetical protein
MPEVARSALTAAWEDEPGASDPSAPERNRGSGRTARPSRPQDAARRRRPPRVARPASPHREPRCQPLASPPLRRNQPAVRPRRTGPRSGPPDQPSLRAARHSGSRLSARQAGLPCSRADGLAGSLPADGDLGGSGTGRPAGPRGWPRRSMREIAGFRDTGPWRRAGGQSRRGSAANPGAGRPS